MRKLLNTLHVMTQGSYLHRDGETVAVVDVQHQMEHHIYNNPCEEFE